MGLTAPRARPAKRVAAPKGKLPAAGSSGAGEALARPNVAPRPGSKVASDTTTLRGRPLRLVPQGLAQADVLELIEEIEASSAHATSKLDHLDSLQTLATRTVEEAGNVAEEIRSQIVTEAQAAAGTILATAQESAKGLVEESSKAATSLIEQAQEEAGQIQAEAVKKAKATTKRMLDKAQKTAEKSADKIVADAIGIAKGILQDASSEPGPATLEEEAARETSGQSEEQASETATSQEPAEEKRRVIRWEPVPSATRYSLYITESPHDDEHIVFDSGDIEDTVLSVPVELKEGDSYKWTIRAGNRGGWGPYGPLMELVV